VIQTGGRQCAEIRIIPLTGIPWLRCGADLAVHLLAAAGRIGGFEDGDVLVVAHKAISKAEGATVSLADVRPSDRARELAADRRDPRLVEVILRESAELVRVRGAFLIARTRHGFVCASAGVDVSNASAVGEVVVLPRDPDASARRLHDRIREATGRRVPVIVSDSFGRAWRRGSVDVAVGVAGMAPIQDLVGQRDPNGYELHATRIAIADELAAAAELALGKTRSIPAAVVRGVATSGEGGANELVIPVERDLFT
jgi:coenzyme F420-0:L-glutamate ligase/coenzyme F420-1:gamma-L-glutamate ligase